MSLKAFHIVFIVFSALLALGFAAWAMIRYLSTNDPWQLGAAILGVGSGIGLVVYGLRFLRRLRKVSFI